MGIIVPTFSLFATEIGASLALVGILTGMSGIASIFASVPIGILSDKWGRKRVIMAGMLFFALTTFLYTVVPNPTLLIPIRILARFGLIGVFMVGIAYVGDVATPEDRGIALGLYSTGMALGFTLGPLIGGVIAERYGYNVTYRLAAVVALVGFVVAAIWLQEKSKTPQAIDAHSAEQRVPLARRIGLMFRDPQMLGASLANLGNNIAFTTIFSFLPLYAVSLSIGDAAIGTMFAMRGLASTLSRIPTGMLTSHLSSRLLMMFGLCLAAVGLFVLSGVQSPGMLIVILIGDGIAYGLFLTAGQSHITELSAEEDRGSAVGLYTMAGSIGGAVGPIAMGVVAEWFGLGSVFWSSALLTLATTVAFKYLNR